MKRFLIPLFLLLCAMSCRPTDAILRGSPEQAADTTATEAKDSIQTKPYSVYAAAVEVPIGYDWARDTAYGAVNAKLVLYKDAARILSIDVGSDISLNPLNHHLIGGNLYTECRKDGYTIITRNGERIARWTGEEVLKGMLTQGDHLITLGVDNASSDLVLRSDGSEIARLDSTVVFGDFGQFSYGNTGALYAYGEHYYFCTTTGWEIQCYKDGVQTGDTKDAMIFANDAKYIDGKLCSISSIHFFLVKKSVFFIGKNRYELPEEEMFDTSGKILKLGGNICVVGAPDNKSDFATQMVSLPSMKCSYFNADLESAYTDGNSLLFARDLGENERILSRNCGQNYEGGLYLAISRTTGNAVISGPVNDTKLELNGYLTAVEVVSNQSK